jgi:hypothetical protein
MEECLLLDMGIFIICFCLKISVDGVSVPEEEREDYAWLQEREIKPEDLPVVGAHYRGPKIGR